MKHIQTFEDFLNESLYEAAKPHPDADGYAVMLTGGSIGEGRPKDAKGYDGKDVGDEEEILDFEEAEEKRKRMNKYLSPGEKKYYKLKYVIVPVKGKKFIK